LEEVVHPIKWKDEIIGDEAYHSMRKHEKPSLTEERDALREEVNRLRTYLNRALFQTMRPQVKCSMAS
ncbi:hypothetical protein DSB75_02345, partial [Salmonella enterica subsp. enterica serovar Typhimurium]